MTEIFAFSVVLLIAVLVSGLANRTILSTAVVFLVAGYLLSSDVLGVVSVTSEDPVLEQLVELALFAVLVHRRHAHRFARSCELHGNCRDGHCCLACRSRSCC